MFSLRCNVTGHTIDSDILFMVLGCIPHLLPSRDSFAWQDLQQSHKLTIWNHLAAGQCFIFSHLSVYPTFLGLIIIRYQVWRNIQDVFSILDRQIDSIPLFLKKFQQKDHREELDHPWGCAFDPWEWKADNGWRPRARRSLKVSVELFIFLHKYDLNHYGSLNVDKKCNEQDKSVILDHLFYFFSPHRFGGIWQRHL